MNDCVKALLADPPWWEIDTIAAALQANLRRNDAGTLSDLLAAMRSTPDEDLRDLIADIIAAVETET